MRSQDASAFFPHMCTSERAPIDNFLGMQARQCAEYQLHVPRTPIYEDKTIIELVYSRLKDDLFYHC